MHTHRTRAGQELLGLRGQENIPPPSHCPQGTRCQLQFRHICPSLSPGTSQQQSSNTAQAPPEPQKPLLPRTPQPASRLCPQNTLHVPEVPRHTSLREYPRFVNPPRAAGGKMGWEEPPSAYQPREQSLRLPAPPPPQTPPPLPASLQRFYPRKETRGERRERADPKLRARLGWKDPTCLCQGLLSTGNNCHVSLELHRLSQAVVSTFLATFHQHTRYVQT